MVYKITIPNLPQYREDEYLKFSFNGEDAYTLPGEEFTFKAPNLRIAKSYFDDPALRALVEKVKIFGDVFLDTSSGYGPYRAKKNSSRNKKRNNKNSDIRRS